jgi:signal peptidase I
MKFTLKKRILQEDGQPVVTSSGILAFIFELIQVAAVSLAIIIPVRYFLIQPFYVNGASMEPSFFDNEYLIIDEISYRFEEPKRGDIVVFRYPVDPKQFFIKRILGLPGETVEVSESGVKIYNDQYPNGMTVDESLYLAQDTVPSAINRTLSLKAGEYFVMGDNRGASLDSRFFGAIKRSDMVGKVWLRGWPFDRWKVFDRIVYSMN